MKTQAHYKLILLFQIVLIPFSLFFLHKNIFYFIVFNLLSFFLVLFIVLNSKDKKIALLSLIILFMGQHIIINLNSGHFYAEPWHSDTWGETQIVEIIVGKGFINLGNDGFSGKSQQYSLYPGLHFFIGELHFLSDLPLDILMKFIIPLINSILVCILLYKILSSFIKDENVVLLSIFMFSTLSYYQWFHSTAVRETIAFPLFLLLVYSFLYFKTPTNLFFGILLITSIFVIHHITFYISLFFIIGYYLLKLGNEKKILAVTLLVLILLLFCFSSDKISFLFSQMYSTIVSINSVLYNLNFSTLLFKIINIAYGNILKISFSLLYYLIPLFLITLYLLRSRDKHLSKVFLFSCVFLFFSVLLRLFSNIEWGYYLSLRSLIYIWVFFSVLFVISLLKLKLSKPLLYIVFLILILGYSVQWPNYVYTNVVAPLNIEAYHASLFAKKEIRHGSILLFDYDNFDVRNRASAIAEMGYLMEMGIKWFAPNNGCGDYYLYISPNLNYKSDKIYSTKGIALGFIHEDCTNI